MMLLTTLFVLYSIIFSDDVLTKDRIPFSPDSHMSESESRKMTKISSDKSEEFSRFSVRRILSFLSQTIIPAEKADIQILLSISSASANTVLEGNCLKCFHFPVLSFRQLTPFLLPNHRLPSLSSIIALTLLLERLFLLFNSCLI